MFSARYHQKYSTGQATASEEGASAPEGHRVPKERFLQDDVGHHPAPARSLGMGSHTPHALLSTLLEALGSLSEVPPQKQITEVSIDSPGGSCL